MPQSLPLTTTQSSHATIPKDCLSTLRGTLPPPPFHQPSFFVRTVARIRRALSAPPRAAESAGVWIWAVRFSAIWGLVLLAFFINRGDYTPLEDLLRGAEAVLGFCIPLLLGDANKIFLSDLQRMQNWTGSLVGFVLWSTGHLCAVQLVLRNEDSHKTTLMKLWGSLDVWAVASSCNTVLIGECATIWGLLIRLFHIYTMAFFAGNKNPDMEPERDPVDPSSSCRPYWTYKLWEIGHIGVAITGCLFISEMILGASVLGLRGPSYGSLYVLQHLVYLGRYLSLGCFLARFAIYQKLRYSSNETVR